METLNFAYRTFPLRRDPRKNYRRIESSTRKPVHRNLGIVLKRWTFVPLFASCRLCMPEHVLQFLVISYLMPLAPIRAAVAANNHTGNPRAQGGNRVNLRTVANVQSLELADAE